MDVPESEEVLVSHKVYVFLVYFFRNLCMICKNIVRTSAYLANEIPVILDLRFLFDRSGQLLDDHVYSVRLEVINPLRLEHRCDFEIIITQSLSTPMGRN